MLDQILQNNHDVCSVDVINLFNQTFEFDFNTVLEGGADEPLYQPSISGKPAKVLFRDDYVSSAMHEISHWMIAGEKRRLLEDYGYWYETDGRSVIQQQAFEQVEIKPQAVELLLHFALGLKFNVSVDNLGLPDYDAKPFKGAVLAQVECFLNPQCTDVLPSRALVFIKAMASSRGVMFKCDRDWRHWLTQSIQN